MGRRVSWCCGPAHCQKLTDTLIRFTQPSLKRAWSHKWSQMASTCSCFRHTSSNCRMGKPMITTCKEVNIASNTHGIWSGTPRRCWLITMQQGYAHDRCEGHTHLYIISSMPMCFGLPCMHQGARLDGGIEFQLLMAPFSHAAWSLGTCTRLMWAAPTSVSCMYACRIRRAKW